jgi:hypothetical protein
MSADLEQLRGQIRASRRRRHLDQAKFALAVLAWLASIAALVGVLWWAFA